MSPPPTAERVDGLNPAGLNVDILTSWPTCCAKCKDVFVLYYMNPQTVTHSSSPSSSWGWSCSALTLHSPVKTASLQGLCSVDVYVTWSTRTRCPPSAPSIYYRWVGSKPWPVVQQIFIMADTCEEVCRKDEQQDETSENCDVQFTLRCCFLNPYC